MKGKVTPSMRYRRFIERSWIDYTLPINQLEILGINSLQEKGKIIKKIYYKKSPKKGRKIPFYKYFYEFKIDWIDFSKGNVLSILKIGPEIEPKIGIFVGAPKFGKTCKKGIIFDEMIYKKSILRPKFDENYTKIFEKLFSEEKKLIFTPIKILIHGIQELYIDPDATILTSKSA